MLTPELARRLSGAAVASAVALTLVFASPAPASAQFGAPPGGFADLAEDLSPAVVNISTATTVSGPGRMMPDFPQGSPFGDLFGGRDGAPRRVQSLGSGFVIDPDGFVVTNNHVIENADEIEVIFSDGTTLPAELIGRDAETDLALLRVQSDDPLPFVPWGDSDAARVGDWVVAIGNPFGLGGSVSAGIISARNRDINAGRYDDFIQTDAAINRGNSGGPLFNLDGEVIGVNTAIFSPTGGSVGIGFSIPSALARVVVDQLREFGEARRGWLGVSIREVTADIADDAGMVRERGAFVAEVAPGGPARAAGLEAGDVIVSFDGRSVDSARDLPRIVAETQVGAVVEVEIFRDGRRMTVDVEIALLNASGTGGVFPSDPSGRLDDEDKDEDEFGSDGGRSSLDDGGVEPSETIMIDSLGIELATLSDMARRGLGIEAREGVLIVDVDRTSSAYENGLRPGDVLLTITQRPVSSPSMAADLVAEERADGRSSILLMIARDGAFQFVSVSFMN